MGFWSTGDDVLPLHDLPNEAVSTVVDVAQGIDVEVKGRTEIDRDRRGRWRYMGLGSVHAEPGLSGVLQTWLRAAEWLIGAVKWAMACRLLSFVS